jgi:hypothetical protein
MAENKYDGRPFEWDRPGVGLYDDGSIRIITSRGPDGSISACHKASDEEVKFIMQLEAVRVSAITPQMLTLAMLEFLKADGADSVTNAQMTLALKAALRLADAPRVATMGAVEAMVQSADVAPEDRAFISRIPQQRQRQDSTVEQLRTVRAWANRLGCYDAADTIRNLLEHRA